MKPPFIRKLLFAALALAFVGWAFRVAPRSPQAGACCASLFSTTAFAADAPVAAASPIAKAALPRLVDLGASRCIPCKMMAPVLEDLKKEYIGRMQVDFIDVWQNPKAGTDYGVRMIPTQIFFDASGKERFRHEGFISKQDILAKWKELGIGFGGKKEAP